MTHPRGGGRDARRLVAGVTLAAVALFALAGIASAHEHRSVADGQYEMVVGFLNEPTIQGQLNGLSLTVTQPPAERAATPTPSAEEDEDALDGEPVTGLESTLHAEVKFADQTMTLDLEPGLEPGRYQALFIPSAAGAYTFHIFGEINGSQVDESFVSGPDTFDDVQASDSMLFPAANSGAGASSAAADAQDSADSAKTLAIIGIVIGALGLVAGVAGVAMAMQSRKPAAAETAQEG